MLYHPQNATHFMNAHITTNQIDWNPILSRMNYAAGQSLPTYTGDLKAALLNHAGLTSHPKGEEAYQLAREMARLTTFCDPEIVYWFSRLVSLMND
ncbi:hypothetical protein NIES37_31540 [Tolypothrix tenuis PCC 7101]|uniref:Uncharacterized protein n=2 Tax=Tolypothrix TaxID=111782 RepID=A0A1Z4N0D2_9CYAN|nr:hypothetical protein NIES37_31540 [Tolypothrix tenuis PCC 7101]BAZ76902.1 hypothetical protein NIES50_55040 [Aulosira laxa NIES-50]